MKKLKLFALAALALVGFAGSANAETVLLAQDDFVGISFWVISMGIWLQQYSSLWKEDLSLQDGELL